jgi:RNA polymerase sigma factor (sigma-70 family)
VQQAKEELLRRYDNLIYHAVQRTMSKSEKEQGFTDDYVQAARIRLDKNGFEKLANKPYINFKTGVYQVAVWATRDAQRELKNRTPNQIKLSVAIEKAKEMLSWEGIDEPTDQQIIEKINSEERIRGTMSQKKLNEVRNAEREVSIDDPNSPFFGDEIASGNSAEDELMVKEDRREMAELIATAISYLEPRKAQVFTLSRVDGLSLDEIACELGLLKGSVSAMLTQARNDLRELLGNCKTPEIDKKTRVFKMAEKYGRALDD